MKTIILLTAVFAAATSINAQALLYPGLARLQSALMGLPGIVFTGQDHPLSISGNEDQVFEGEFSYGNPEGRSKFYGGVAEGRQGDDLLGSVGGDVNLNSIPNPFLNFRKESYPQRAKTIVVPPVCVACKCQVGFKSCADAGGKQWVSGECSAKPDLSHSKGDECAYSAPSSLSACDSSCVKTCPAKEDAKAPAISDCTPIDAVNKKQCTTPCENLARATIIKCNSAYPDVISNIPSPCYNTHLHHRYRRSANNRLPATEIKSEVPDIHSSHESPSDRSGRFLKLNINPFQVTNPRVNYNPVTNFVRGYVTATYVAADGVCLPGDLASAPLCP